MRTRNRATASGETDGQATASGETDGQATASGATDVLTANSVGNESRQRLTSPSQTDARPVLSTKITTRIGTLNLRTLSKPGKKDMLLREANRYNWDIIGLSETHLPGISEEQIGDATLLLSGRQDGTHRQGVGFLLTKAARKSLLSVVSVSERLMMIRLKSKFKNLSVVQVYAPDSSRSDEESEDFYSQLQSLVDTIPKKDIVLVLGDFNAIVGSDNSGNEDVMGKFGIGQINGRGERLTEFCRDNELFITNTMFKHRRKRKVTWWSPNGRTANMIDYILVSSRWKSSFTDTVTLGGGDFDSDHNLLMSSLRLRLKAVVKPKQKVPRFRIEALKDLKTRQEYRMQLNERLSKTLQETPDLLSPADIDLLVSQSSLAVCETAELVLGRKSAEDKPWITQEIIDMCTEKRTLQNKQDRESKDRFKNLKRQIEKKTRQALKDMITEKCRQCEEDSRRGNSHLMFKRARELTNRKEAKCLDLLDKNGHKITTCAGIRDRWKEHFQEKLNLTVNPDPEVLRKFPAHRDEEPPPPPLRSEVEAALKSLKSNKAPGIDGIQAELLKVESDIVVDLYHKIVTAVWEIKYFPESWSKSVIVPLHKKGSKSNCENYRPISLTCQPAKILTKILLDRIRNLTRHVIPEYQAGFRQNRSTIDQIFVIRQIMERYLEFGKELYQLFIDFKQAFDLIWRDGLWHILAHYGIPTDIIDIIKSMYEKSRSMVQTSEGFTEEFSTSSGVLQGCLLSPTLFCLFLNAVLALVPNDTGALMSGHLFDLLAYADDINRLNEQLEELQSSANDIDHAASSFGMKINANKTKAMKVTRHIDTGLQPSKIMIQGEEIEWVDHFVYLGSELTSTNDSSKDIKRRLALASACFKSLRSIWKNKHLSLKLKTRLFRALVVPVATYGAETWTLKAEDKRRLAAFETKSLRKLAGITYLDRISNERLLSSLNYSQTIMQTIQLQQLRWLGHVQRMSPAQLPKIAFEGRIDASRPKGRPPKRWRENFPSHPLSVLLRTAANRESYKKLCHSSVRGEAPSRPIRPDGS